MNAGYESKKMNRPVCSDVTPPGEPSAKRDEIMMTGTDVSLFDSLGGRAQTLIVTAEGGQSRVSG